MRSALVDAGAGDESEFGFLVEVSKIDGAAIGQSGADFGESLFDVVVE